MAKDKYTPRNSIPREPRNKNISPYARRARRSQGIAVGFIYTAAVIAVGVLFAIVLYIVVKGSGSLSLEFLLEGPKDRGAAGGILPMIINTLYLIILGLLFSTPIAVCAAIYMTEYAREGLPIKLIRYMTENLSGIPSVIFGLFGFIFFGKYLGLKWSLLNGALTVAVVILPTIIRSTEEAIKTVPKEYREGSLALGASKWSTIVKVVLPSAMPGILTGIMLGMGRIVGETAALYLTLGNGDRIATSVFQSARSLSLHLYTLASEGISRGNAFATATVLIVIILIINLLANCFTHGRKG